MKTFFLRQTLLRRNFTLTHLYFTKTLALLKSLDSLEPKSISQPIMLVVINSLIRSGSCNGFSGAACDLT